MQPDFRDIVDLLDDAVIVTEGDLSQDDGARVVYMNPAFGRLTGHSLAELQGQGIRGLWRDGNGQRCWSRLWAKLQHGEPAREMLLQFTREGRPFYGEITVTPLRGSDGRIGHLLVVQRGVNGHREAESQTQTAPTRDGLTGLFGRHEFLQRAEAAHAHALANGQQFGLMLLDVDHFRTINATHGHDLGDRLLTQVANALRVNHRAQDFAGRIAGDEFALAMPGIDPEKALDLALLIRLAIRSIRLPDLPWLGITSSIGVACTEGSGDSLAVLLARADRACERSRRAGRNRASVDRASGKVVPFRRRHPSGGTSAALVVPANDE